MVYIAVAEKGLYLISLRNRHKNISKGVTLGDYCYLYILYFNLKLSAIIAINSEFVGFLLKVWIFCAIIRGDATDPAR